MFVQLAVIYLSLGLIFVQGTNTGSPAIRFEVSGHTSERVVLPCQLSEETCGPIHSIKWHRGFRRVYIFSEIGSTSKAEDDLIGRADVRLEKNNSLALLEIDPLMAADEDFYKCEVTYLEAKEHCTLLQYIRLNTYAVPEFVRIESLSGTETVNASLIGPFNEGTLITLVCNTKGGKPIPNLNWFNNSVSIEGQKTGGITVMDRENVTEHDGTGSGSSQLQVQLTRGDLGARFECRASSPTLKRPIATWVEVDVYVKPLWMKVTGYDAPPLEGTIVTLVCRVEGARPSANITWYNDTQPLNPQPLSKEIPHDDGTYETESRLSFTATRYDNGVTLDCQASNLVLEAKEEGPMHVRTKIQVNYKPVVTIWPPNITVNETTDILLNCGVDSNPPERISVRWYQNNQMLDLSDISHYEGGTTLEPSLLIKNSRREDVGNYSCLVQNSIGETASDVKAVVNVLYKAKVVVSMDPPTPVREQDERNVTLSCDVESGNPGTLDAVRWYLDGDLLKELPDCLNLTTVGGGGGIEGGGGGEVRLVNELCDIDPSKLMLEAVARSFQGNYQCRAKNQAGWGDLSPKALLQVYYPPGPAKIVFEPKVAVKGQGLSLRCLIDEPGRPPAKEFRWWRGAHVQQDQKTSNWTIFPVSLESRANFSCEALNEAGQGPSSSAPVNVFVPPTFIVPLMPYHGVPWNAIKIQLTCQVECFPICEIYWLKNGLPINFQEAFFTIKNTRLRPDRAKNDFESVVSTLGWNLTAWPNGRLNRAIDNDNYTCQSSANAYGSGVYSTTHFRVEYPPEKIQVFPRVVNVKEDEYADVVTCSANALPEAIFQWRKGKEILSEKNVLFLNYTLKRDQGGDYECIAKNLHGQVSTYVSINVLYVPECKITFEEDDDERVLVCTAKANPGLVDFQWALLGNGTLGNFPEKTVKRGLRSEIRLNSPVPALFGTYRCFANNSVGAESCDFTLSGSWIRKIGSNTLLVFLGIGSALLLVSLALCTLIILCCRKRRKNEKQHNSRVDERTNQSGFDYERFIINLYGPGVVPEGRAYISTYNASPSLSSTNFTSTPYTDCPERNSPAHRKGDMSENGKIPVDDLQFQGLQSPSSKTLLTPYSLHVHQSSHNHHTLAGGHRGSTPQGQHGGNLYQLPGPTYATHHRGFPAQTSDLVFSSLQRGSGSMGYANDAVECHQQRSRPSNWYNQSEQPPNGKLTHNVGGGSRTLKGGGYSNQNSPMTQEHEVRSRSQNGNNGGLSYHPLQQQRAKEINI